MKLTMKSLVSLLLVVLLAAAALTGCAKTQQAGSTDAPASQAQTQTEAAKTDAPQTTAEEAASVIELGEGDKLFYLEVTFAEGETSSYAIHTDAETVGEALNGLDLIEGENGLYNTVCGKTLDWNEDHMYWAFYIDEAYASTGLDDTPISQEAHYALTATAG